MLLIIYLLFLYIIIENVVKVDSPKLSEKDHHSSATHEDCESVRSKTIHGTEEDEKQPNVDGGYGWLIVIGAFLVQITSYGVTTAW